MPDGLGVSVTESSQFLTATAMGRGGMIGSRLCKSMLVGACALTIAGAALAQTRDFNVPEGELQAALDAYARQSGLQVIYRIEDVHGTRSKGVQGALSVADALKTLLEGTGVSVERDASRWEGRRVGEEGGGW